MGVGASGDKRQIKCKVLPHHKRGSVTLTSVYTSETVSCYPEQKRCFTRLVSAQEQQENNEGATKECTDFFVSVYVCVTRKKRKKKLHSTSALNYQ